MTDEVLLRFQILCFPGLLLLSLLGLPLFSCRLSQTVFCFPLGPIGRVNFSFGFPKFSSFPTVSMELPDFRPSHSPLVSSHLLVFSSSSSCFSASSPLLTLLSPPLPSSASHLTVPVGDDGHRVSLTPPSYSLAHMQYG
jgi:hypothetical protein